MTVCGREGGAEMNEWKINYISSLYEARLYTVAVQYTHTHTVSTVFFSAVTAVDWWKFFPFHSEWIVLTISA